ncbi:hypothetical protein Sme01_18520 [Sphaerisporangium melleum]|uniref:Uncharacterized protein n=1 Tax=Sphaerisporangium melleum TaxID=321316 RepID=A0A917RMG7_9ACTN|nr:hypothetical protein [Sphaerisporangium melleum]GGL14661.1 hypothetical protein GCM10007964_65890 [Sphaerisporangium melleum]GII69376.1 hypothetical protein Sme01_18520 [Sphaerisporangium melleum]
MTDSSEKPHPGYLLALWKWLSAQLVSLYQAAVRHLTRKDILTFEEVAAYLRENAKRAQAARAALVRRPRSGGWTFRIVFLDDTNEPVVDPATGRPLGRVVRADDCDDELRRMFAGKEMILFD